MREIGDAFAARLAAGETTLCACWRFARADGETFGATDHDVEIAFDGVTYAPAAGLRGQKVLVSVTEPEGGSRLNSSVVVP